MIFFDISKVSHQKQHYLCHRDRIKIFHNCYCGHRQIEDLSQGSSLYFSLIQKLKKGKNQKKQFVNGDGLLERLQK